MTDFVIWIIVFVRNILDASSLWVVDVVVVVVVLKLEEELLNWVELKKWQWMQHNERGRGLIMNSWKRYSNKDWVVKIIAPLGTILSTFPQKTGRDKNTKLTVGCPGGVALGAVGGVRRCYGGHAGAPDETESCEASCCNTTCEARGTKARVAGSFVKERPGRCNLGLGACCCCCCLWSRSSMMGKDLIC